MHCGTVRVGGIMQGVKGRGKEREVAAYLAVHAVGIEVAMVDSVVEFAVHDAGAET